MQGLICDFPHSSDGKASAYNVEDRGSVPGLGRSPGEGNDNPLQYSILENPMGGGAWWSTVHGVTKSQTQLSNFTSVFHGCSSPFFFFSSFLLIVAFLVVQWLRISLPVQGTWVRSPVLKIPHATGQLSLHAATTKLKL